MPRTYLMTWQADKSRWKKMHKGQLFFFVPLQHNLPPTKEESWQAANAWWQHKFHSLSAGKDILAAQDQGELLAQVQRGEAARSMLNLLANGQATLEAAEQSHAVARMIGNGLPLTANGQASLATALDAKLRTAAPGEKTMGECAEVWKGLQIAREKAGNVGASRTAMNFILLEKFLLWAGKNASPKTVDEVKWSAWYVHLLEQKVAQSYKQRIWQVSKRFMDYMAEHRLIDLPRNLHSKDFGFKVSPKTPKTLTVAQIRAALKAATVGQSQLHMLLMLNCGMLPIDISDLRQDEVNWKEGTITRKRSKTSDEESVPKVTYKLWPETLKQLRTHRSKATTVLTTKSGGAWVTESLENGKLKRADNVSSCFKYFAGKLPFKMSPKLFRASAATLLGEHPRHKLYGQYFLGHSPRTIADKHYIVPSEKEFFAALDWLREQIIE